MKAKRINLKYIPRILSSKPLLEYFMSILLDEPVQLPCWPKETSWDYIYPFADLFVRSDDGILVSLSANLFDPEHIVDELRLSASDDAPTCSIAICDRDVVGLGQSYCRIVPMAVGISETKRMDSSWQIHVLAFGQGITKRNAPPEIQQLLDHMAGMETQPAPGSLLSRMLDEDFVWCFLCGARHGLKSVYHDKYEKLAQEETFWRIDLLIERYSQGYIEGYTKIEEYTKELQHMIATAAKFGEPLSLSWISNDIPDPMVRDVMDGKEWTQDDLLQWYKSELSEEAKRRRAETEAADTDDQPPVDSPL